MLAEPDLPEELVPYYQAFQQLGQGRPRGFGLAAIPSVDIGDYFDRLGWADFETFLRRIRACDSALLAWHDEQQPPPETPE